MYVKLLFFLWKYKQISLWFYHGQSHPHLHVTKYLLFTSHRVDRVSEQISQLLRHSRPLYITNKITMVEKINNKSSMNRTSGDTSICNFTEKWMTCRSSVYLYFPNKQTAGSKYSARRDIIVMWPFLKILRYYK